MAQEGPKMAQDRPNMVPRGGVIDFSYMKVFGICGFEKNFRLREFFSQAFFHELQFRPKANKNLRLRKFFLFFVFHESFFEKNVSARK